MFFSVTTVESNAMSEQPPTFMLVQMRCNSLPRSIALRVGSSQSNIRHMGTLTASFVLVWSFSGSSNQSHVYTRDEKQEFLESQDSKLSPASSGGNLHPLVCFHFKIHLPGLLLHVDFFQNIPGFVLTTPWSS